MSAEFLEIMKKISNLRAIVISFFIFAVCADAQTSTPTPSPTPDDEADYIVASRPTFSNPAEFQRPGVLQLQFGYNGNFHATDFKSQQDAPMNLRFAVNRRLLLELDTDSPYSQKDLSGARQTGAGDTNLRIQGVLQTETLTRPGIALAYQIKLPTASAAKNLGTGRVDHTFTGLVSKKFGSTTVDFNAIYQLAGRTSDQGHASSGQGAVAVTQSLNKKFGVQGELSGYSRSDEQKGAMLALGVVTYQVNKRLIFDSGVRFGLNKDAPRFGIVAGFTVGIANLYKKRHH